ncbi:hypothetical protein LK996_06890 [Lysobacter sp. A6]|uniref:Uncharacterized protein n=1 Tax=Noviluteimonas lactosilytica TaxID=2888523 RepID=A0ABS8JGT1_9GAMM|nr:hypothetical protein [Lysobacter lactosilyticus]MCC8362801.1 hypothetical protein [Lysobacter lactosilyticus]
MRLQLSPFAFLRRHAWGLAVLCVVVVGYFATVGWFAEKLGDDLGRSFKAAPVVDDTKHRSD